MINKEGEEMPFPKRYLSHLLAQQLDGQQTIGLCLVNNQLPTDRSLKDLVLETAEGCFIEDGIIWKRSKRPNEAPRVVISPLPHCLIPSVLQEAHGTLLSSDDCKLKTKEQVVQCHFWPGMETDIQKHIQQCV